MWINERLQQPRASRREAREVTLAKESHAHHAVAEFVALVANKARYYLAYTRTNEPYSSVTRAPQSRTLEARANLCE
jgi:hypothetical protein